MPALSLRAATHPAPPIRTLPRPRVLTRLLPRPELGALLALTALLDLRGLAQNGWANTYYSAAVRSMSSSWHNFLFASFG